MCFMMSEFEWYPRLLLEYDTVRLPQAGFGTLLNWILPRILRGVEILFNRSKANMSANNTRNKISDNVYVKVGKQSQFELRKDNWGQGPRVEAEFRLVRGYRRPHSERFCDVAFTVKCYCDCDVAKSLRMGPHATEIQCNARPFWSWIKVRKNL